MAHRPEIVLTFTLHDGSEPRGPLRLGGDRIRIGRGHSSELRLDDVKVARMHAVIEIGGPDRVELVGLGPSTRVNGAEVERCRLCAGDVIEMGSSRVEVTAIERTSLPGSVAATDGEPARRPSSPGGLFIPALLGFEPACAVGPDAPEGSYEYRLLPSAPAVPADLCETQSEALTLELWWGQNLLHVAHLTAGASYHLGEIEAGPERCDYFVPASKLGAARAAMVLRGRAIVPAAAEGSLRLPGAPAMPLGDAAERGLLQPATAAEAPPGSREIALGLGSSLTLELADLRLVIRAERQGKRAAARWTAGAILGGTAAWVLGSFVVHTGLLAAVAALVPSLGADVGDELSEDQRYWVQQHVDAAADLERQAQETEKLDEQADGEEGGSGTRSIGDEGSMGNPISRASEGRWAMRGSASPEDQRIAARQAIEDARSFGVIGLLDSGLGASGGPIAPWGGLESVGSDAIDAQGTMWGNAPGDAYGAGGLGLSGIGEGGGGRGEGIGLGSIGTVGGGSGKGPREGFGNGTGPLGRHRHVTRPPRVRVTDTQVSGRLPPEAIQRVVRMSHGRFRACYEGGLRSNPNLRGRVLVRFVIGRDGAVHSASGGGDLADGAVTSCITAAFYGLTFPSPEGGIVTVTYPILLEPAQ
jgi:pSer/pThr/pTyr-binding forkhead associated (FHA) protein